MEWFRKASDQGHPHASYNLAIGHMQGIHEHLDRGDAERLIAKAAENGVPEAADMMDTHCVWGNCDQ